jgi:hypothetical protein
LSGPARFAIAAVVGIVALAVAGNAFGQSYEPSLRLTPTKYTLGTKAGVSIVLQQGSRCCAPGRITVYSPPGYAVKLEHPAGARIGTLIGVIWVGDAEHRVLGSITAENPLSHVNNSCAPGRHDAVWMFEFEAAPYRFRVPMYVDRVTAAPEAAYASARMDICFASPYVPPPEGAPERIAIGDLAIGIGDVFTSPTSAGTYAWNAVFVPYRPGTATMINELAAQSTSYVRLPVALDLTIKRLRRGGRTFAATVCLRENGQAIRGALIQIVGRPRPRGSFTRYGVGRTDARGCITRRFQPKHKVILGHVWVQSPLRRGAACSGALAPRCSRPTVAPVYLDHRFRIRR